MFAGQRDSIQKCRTVPRYAGRLASMSLHVYYSNVRVNYTVVFSELAISNAKATYMYACVYFPLGKFAHTRTCVHGASRQQKVVAVETRSVHLAPAPLVLSVDPVFD